MFRRLTVVSLSFLFIAASIIADTYWVPIAGHTAGAGGARWQTDLAIVNACAVPLPVEIQLNTAEGSHTKAFVISAGAHQFLEDVVGDMVSTDAIGALRIRVEGTMAIDARTWDASGADRNAQPQATLTSADGFGTGSRLVLPLLAQNAQARTNIGVLNMGDDQAEVSIELRDANGGAIGSYELEIAPGQVVLDLRPFFDRFSRNGLPRAYAVVTVTSGSLVYPFASVVRPGGVSDSVEPRAISECPDSTTVQLDPTFIPQFTGSLVVPPVMMPDADSVARTDYSIAAREFMQQLLPEGFPSTRVWGYGRAGDSSSFHYPAFTIEATVNKPVRVTWINDLVDENGGFIPHRLPVDTTMPWANPPGPPDGNDDGPFAPYGGPVPIVSHLHGAHVESHSDGFPQAWFLPAANDIPEGYFKHGTNYGGVAEAPEGAAIFEYTNDQRPTTLWYHDHALGMTRLNVYMGLSGFWLIRDAFEQSLGLPGPAPAIGDAPGKRHYEIPIVIQDRTFNTDGSLFYPASREFFDGYTGPYVPETEVHPVWNPEFFGDTIVVNGRVWPSLDVEPRLYRLRLLNGSNSRFLILKFDREGIPFTQIGADGGLLSGAPVVRDDILLAPAQRADVIVDFSGLAPGDRVTLLNLGPDEPFGGTFDFEPANPATTGRVMQLRVVARTNDGIAGSIPATLPVLDPLTSTLPSRDLTLNEMVATADEIPVEALLGTADDGGLEWRAAVTEKPHLGDTEIWRILNLTVDAHPIHLHLVQFEVLDRTPFDAEEYAEAQANWLACGKCGAKPQPDDFITGATRQEEPWESGRIDTVIANPGEITRIAATFDLAGLYVWHCHILEHEDNEMMRKYEVIP